MPSVEARDRAWIREAVELSRSAPRSTRAFSVGCAIVTPDGRCVATGYSRENDDLAHAEEVAIEKAESVGVDLRSCTLYSSLEPCGARLSPRRSCVTRILEVGIPRVVYAFAEPALFVEAHGERLLRAGGVDVRAYPEFAEEVVAINGHLLGAIAARRSGSENV
uniref:5-amino-6-(5-phosphoribosylamino)uracil reductase n=1 Tax=mine drainage metagenome TaxID=410659 RepID=E6PE99_9ZZZZ